MATPKAPGRKTGDGPASHARARNKSDNNPPESVDGVAADELKTFIERIERLNEEKANIAADIKDVFAEAKGRGFDVKQMRKIIQIRKQDHAERQEQEAILELYMQALNMI